MTSPVIAASAQIHPLAFVAEATIGHGTRIWQFASIIRAARVGSGCTIGACALVDAAIIGDDCLIGAAAQLHPGTVIGNAVFVGPGVIFCNDRWPRVSKDGFDTEALLGGKFVTVRVEDGAVIGAGAIILPGVTIGKGAVIAAGSRVARSVPAYYLVKARDEMLPLAPRRAERMCRAH